MIKNMTEKPPKSFAAYKKLSKIEIRFWNSQKSIYYMMWSDMHDGEQIRGFFIESVENV